MRYLLAPALTLFLAAALPAQAQSIIDNLPAGGSDSDSKAEDAAAAKAAAPQAAASDTYTVTDVNADVTADTAAHARDQALMQAERSAYTTLIGRLSLDPGAAKLDDDSVAGLVQSFEVQSERLSAVRYIGVFTIRFKPALVQKKFPKAMDAGGNPPVEGDVVKPVASGPLSHVTASVPTQSLAAWMQIKRRLTAAPPVAHVDMLDLGRGTSHIDITYGGGIADLQQALTSQGLVLRQSPAGTWDIYDGSMVTR